MEDVYHYTRSPAWEELVSKIQHWRLFFSFFPAHFAQQKEQNESCCCNALSCRGLIRSLFCFGGVSSSLTRFACFPLCCCDLFSGLTLQPRFSFIVGCLFIYLSVLVIGRKEGKMKQIDELGYFKWIGSMIVWTVGCFVVGGSSPLLGSWGGFRGSDVPLCSFPCGIRVLSSRPLHGNSFQLCHECSGSDTCSRLLRSDGF